MCEAIESLTSPKHCVATKEPTIMLSKLIVTGSKEKTKKNVFLFWSNFAYSLVFTDHSHSSSALTVDQHEKFIVYLCLSSDPN